MVALCLRYHRNRRHSRLRSTRLRTFRGRAAKIADTRLQCHRSGVCNKCQKEVFDSTAFLNDRSASP